MQEAQAAQAGEEVREETGGEAGEMGEEVLPLSVLLSFVSA